jgi:transposase-like protein
MNAKIPAFLRCPALPHKRIRPTNLIERAFAEQRHRTKTIPRFWNERRGLQLVFATLGKPVSGASACA